MFDDVQYVERRQDHLRKIAESVKRATTWNMRGRSLTHTIAGQDELVAQLEARCHTHRKLMMFGRAQIKLSTEGRNTVEILQEATAFYSRLI